MRPVLRVSLAVGATLGPATAGAATWFVAPGGSATNAGTEASPWNVGKAVSTVVAGDVVVFADGTYENQNVVLTRSGYADRPITFRAADGAVPVFRGADGNTSDGLNAGAVVHDIVIDGLWFENWRYGGIALSWTHHGVSNIVVRHCVADNNQMNGIDLFFASNITVENNIASRNGWGPSSWSSNVNIYAVTGTDNVIRGNVAFHGIDTSSHASDGNGFILDLAINGGSALFENNIAFGNGGAGIAVTDSRGARLVNNTCFHDAQATAAGELSFVDTCRGDVDGIPVNRGHYALIDALLRNNVAVAASGKAPLKRWACGVSTAWVHGTVDHNVFVASDGSSLFENPAAADFRPKRASALVDAGGGTEFAADGGFDPRCLRTESGQRYPWWTHAPDLAHIRSIGGISHCFVSHRRPRGAAPDVGAYEFGDAGPGAGSAAVAGATLGGGCACGAVRRRGSRAPVVLGLLTASLLMRRRRDGVL